MMKKFEKFSVEFFFFLLMKLSKKKPHSRIAKSNDDQAENRSVLLAQEENKL